MKKILLVHLLACIMYGGGIIWGIVSFILYLVKDRPFDWISIVIALIGFIIPIVNMLVIMRK